MMPQPYTGKQEKLGVGEEAFPWEVACIVPVSPETIQTSIKSLLLNFRTLSMKAIE